MSVEPWLRGTLIEVEPVKRAVLHALELAEEDITKWCDGLCEEQMTARPHDLPPVAFHLRHIARSLDRLLTYAEDAQLSADQMIVFKTEMEGSGAEAMRELREGLRRSMERVRAIAPEQFAEARGVGRKMLPTTVAGLVVHCTDHTQRHVGQLVTTVKVLRNSESKPQAKAR